MAKCASCGHKGTVASESWWQKFFPVKAWFCRACFSEAASAGHSSVQTESGTSNGVIGDVTARIELGGDTWKLG